MVYCGVTTCARNCAAFAACIEGVVAVKTLVSEIVGVVAAAEGTIELEEEEENDSSEEDGLPAVLVVLLLLLVELVLVVLLLLLI